MELGRNASHNHVIFKASHLNDEALHAAGHSCGHTAPLSGDATTVTAEEMFPTDNTIAAEFRLRSRCAHANKESTINSDLSTAVGAQVGAASSMDCRAYKQKCSCVVSLYADHMFLASYYGQGSVNIAEQYMVNQLVVADSNFRRANMDGYVGYGLAWPSRPSPCTHPGKAL